MDTARDAVHTARAGGAAVIAQPARPCPTWLKRLAAFVYQRLVQPAQPIATHARELMCNAADGYTYLLHCGLIKVRKVRQVGQGIERACLFPALPAHAVVGQGWADAHAFMAVSDSGSLGRGEHRNAKVLPRRVPCGLKACGDCPVTGIKVWLRDQRVRRVSPRRARQRREDQASPAALSALISGRSSLATKSKKRRLRQACAGTQATSASAAAGGRHG